MTAELRIGCSSWTSEAWWGRVYPRGIADGERLGYYARLYDTVEVDSTYYRAPPRGMVVSWRNRTPDGFRFTLKFPRDLLDPKPGVDRPRVREFEDSARGLDEKLGPILLQFPPWVKPGRATEFLYELLGALDPGLAYSVELRDAAWYRGEVWERLQGALRDRAIPLAWSHLSYVDVPPEVTGDFAYLRFIGDHDSIPAETHGEIRADRTPETRRWAERLKRELERLKTAYVFFNNHFAGLAPASLNLFREEMGLPPVDYGKYARGAARLEDIAGEP